MVKKKEIILENDAETAGCWNRSPAPWPAAFIITRAGRIYNAEIARRGENEKEA